MPLLRLIPSRATCFSWKNIAARQIFRLDKTSSLRQGS